MVAYHHLKWRKWVRARIIEKTEGEFKLFFIDHGHYRYNRDLNLFAELPESLQKESRRVIKGTLGLQPGTKFQNCDTLENVVRATHCWSKDAVNYFQNLFANRSRLQFFFVYSGENFNDMQIGDLTFKWDNSERCESLKEEIIAKLWAVNPINLENLEKIVAVVSPEPNDIEKDQVTMIPTGTSTHDLPINEIRKESPKKMEVKSEKLEAKQLVKIEESKVKPPMKPKFILEKLELKFTIAPEVKSEVKPRTEPAPVIKQVPSKQSQDELPQVSDMFVFGHSLNEPVQSIVKAPFNNRVRKNLLERISGVSKVHAHSWANLVGNRSMVIVAKYKNDATFAFLPAVVSLLIANQEFTDEVGPRAIIISKSSAEVKEIVRLCSQLAPSLSIVQVYGRDDKVAEVLNGCDLLLSTPKAVHQICQEASLYLPFIDRLQHLVFDGVDLMMQSCEMEVKEIVSFCLKGRLGAENRLQIVFTSNKWVKDIETKVISPELMKDVVLCIEDFIEAAACVGCEFSMEFCKTLEERIENLEKLLENPKFKSTRTILVTNKPEDIRDKLRELSVVADETNYQTVKRAWTQQSVKKFPLLITNDLVLQKMELRNFQHLIHFTVPKSWEDFTRRFEVLLDQVYFQRETKSIETLPTTKIFLDDKNVMQFAKIVDFLKSRKFLKVSEAAVAYAKVRIFNFQWFSS